MQRLNQNLLDILIKTTRELILYANKHNIEYPYEITLLLERALEYTADFNGVIDANKRCNSCNKINPSNADFCQFCGNCLVITRVRQSDDITRNGDRTLTVDDQIIFVLFCISDFIGMQDGKNTISEPVHQIDYQRETPEE